jgi:hypothetical protein
LEPPPHPGIMRRDTTRGRTMMGLRMMMGAAALVATLAAAPAFAAIELEPGTWQDTETGTENGKAAKPDVSTDCMTAEDAKDPMKALARMKEGDGANQCKTLDIRQNGNVVTLKMVCGDDKQGKMEMAGTFTFIDRRHYTTSMKSTISFGGQTMTSDKQVDSRWIAAACNKK